MVRLGGDEFAVVLPGTSAENAVVLLEELRRHLAGMAVDGVGDAVSASVGIGANPPHGTTAEDLYRAAGAALMRAKRDGRDRVAMYVEEKMVLKSNYYSKANLERLWAFLPSLTGPKPACSGRHSTTCSTSTRTCSEPSTRATPCYRATQLDGASTHFPAAVAPTERGTIWSLGLFLS